MKDSLLLVFANKQDIDGGAFLPYPQHIYQTNYTTAMEPEEVKQRLQLDKLNGKITWSVTPSCATTGVGLLEGLVRHLAPSSIYGANPLQAWLSNNIKTPPAGTTKK